MVLQARTGRIALPADDVEKVPVLPSTNDDLSDITGKNRPKRSSLLDLRFRLSPKSVPEALFLLLGTIALWSLVTADFPWPSKPSPPPTWLEDGIRQCKFIAQGPPSPQPDVDRQYSDRFAPGTGAYHLKNATIWTGNDDGNEVLYNADVWLEGGVIRQVGGSQASFKSLRDNAKEHDRDVHEYDLDGAWLTPGIVDMHSHMGIGSAPSLEGAEDTNSVKASVLPWLRSLDGFNTHDDSFNLSIAGGITTMMVLPGSADSIGGQAFVFKPRTTYENTPTSMQLEPPFRIVPGQHGETAGMGYERTGAWRHMKHACGENPKRVYHQTRMDNSWDMRSAYEHGRQLIEKQDEWCASPQTQKEPFPTDLQWEVIADIIRGNVIVNNHCYETVDLNNMVRISNEFKFHIASFHHAHETYLVPDLLKQMYGGPPAVAIFATNARYKREAYRGTEYAGAILAEAGINVAYKSDHSVLDSRYLLFEAQQGHHYGLNFSQALGTITTHSSKAIGMDHRVGYVRQGYDADVVIWDSFPLALGATPKQTFIDGIPQLTKPHFTKKPAEAQEITKPGPWKEAAKEALATRGNPDLRSGSHLANVIFTNVKEVHLPARGFSAAELAKDDVVVVRDGDVVCAGACTSEVLAIQSHVETDIVDLQGGSLTHGLITVGSPLGVAEIDQEASTHDGSPYDAQEPVVKLEDGIVVHAADGAQFDGKNDLTAYRAGVTVGVTGPQSSALVSGLSFAFGTSALHPLEDGAILHRGPSVFLNLEASAAEHSSVSTQIAILRRVFKGDYNETSELVEVLGRVKRGELRAVVSVNSADHIASLVRLKRDWAPGMKLTLLGAAESWMLADELAKEDVGVIVHGRSFPFTWQDRRILPGLPLSQQSLAGHLASRGVLVGLGIREAWSARNTRLEAAWLYANEPEQFSKSAALDLVSRNLAELLGLKDDPMAMGQQGEPDLGWVAWGGDMFSFQGRVKAIRAPGEKKTVHLI